MKDGVEPTGVGRGKRRGALARPFRIPLSSPGGGGLPNRLSVDLAPPSAADGRLTPKRWTNDAGTAAAARPVCGENLRRVGLSRRGALLGVASAALPLSRLVPGALSFATPSALAAPALVPAEVTPEEFGAGRGNSAADTAAWNAAISSATAVGRPVRARGTYVLSVGPEKRWSWAGRADAPVRIAVNLPSGAHIDGAGATILVGSPNGPVSSRLERHLLFGTDHHMTVGALRNVKIEGLTFDFRHEFGPLHSLTYATGIVGVDGFSREGCRYVSTGARAGRCLLSENVAHRFDRSLVHENIVQGIFSRYEYGVTMTGISFDGFVEALDFDGPCWDVNLDQLIFRNGSGEAQCIDTAGGARWLITNIEATRTGSIIYVYIKANAWPSYAGWFTSSNGLTRDYVEPRSFVVRGVRGDDVGFARRRGEAARIGSLRVPHTVRRIGPLPRRPCDVVLEDWKLEGGGNIEIHDCDSLLMHAITLRGTRAGSAALVVDPGDPALGGRVTGAIRQVEIDCPKIPAVAIAAGPDLVLSDVRARLSEEVAASAVRVLAGRGSLVGPRGAVHVDICDCGG